MNDRFILRRANDTDDITLAELNRKTFLETYIDHLNIPLCEHDIESYFQTSVSSKIFADQIQDPQQAVWIVQDKTNGEYVAFASVGVCRIVHPDVDVNDDGEIYRIYTQRDRQGYGIGQWLMTVALLWLEERFPGRSVWLGIAANNLTALNFYKHYNFNIVNNRDYEVGKFKIHSFIMRRESSIEWQVTLVAPTRLIRDWICYCRQVGFFSHRSLQNDHFRRTASRWWRWWR